MDSSLYVQLSVMMFLEFAIWGAWSPVLAARLLGPLKMNGKQTGWIYATIPLASILVPMFAGQVTDLWVPSEWFLLGAHLIGAVLLIVSAFQKSFGRLFVVMGLYSLCYASTLSIVAAMTFTHAKGADPTPVFIWAPIAWALVGWLLGGWRRWAGTGSGNDCLILAGVLSFAMVACCFFLPHTPPQGAQGEALPFIKALSLLQNTDFLIFLVISFVVTTQLQFYFIGTAQYLQDLGVESRNVPAVMAIAQAAQALATWYALTPLIDRGGFHWTLAAGALCWLGLYLAYAVMRPRWFVISSQALHGLAYVFFIIGGQYYVSKVAPQDISNSAQALLQVVTMGLGLFLGTQFTGIVMDHFRTADGKFRWRPIFLVPCALMLACSIGLIVAFKG